MEPNQQSRGPDEAIAPWLEQELFRDRIVVIATPLTSARASHVASALLVLDSFSADPVRVQITAIDGDLSAALSIVDAIDTMRSPVHAVVPSTAGGAAIAVLAAADKRMAYRHARIQLTEPRASAIAGTADQVAAAAGAHLREVDELIERLAEVTKQPRSRVENDMGTRLTLSADEALAYGLIDEILGKPRS